jgi:hypothetical protein
VKIESTSMSSTSEQLFFINSALHSPDPSSPYSLFCVCDSATKTVNSLIVTSLDMAAVPTTNFVHYFSTPHPRFHQLCLHPIQLTFIGRGLKGVHEPKKPSCFNVIMLSMRRPWTTALSTVVTYGLLSPNFCGVAQDGACVKQFAVQLLPPAHHTGETRTGLIRA